MITAIILAAAVVLLLMWMRLDAATERADAAEYVATELRTSLEEARGIIRKQDAAIVESLNIIATLRDENRAQRICEREQYVYYCEN
jgi:hypothetical protein